ncbi:S-adenosyl-L-methionine-dependent methyltransferase [Pluteus cervinus]|uniref:S-adenosyl-L-methionine-dependent methyltransferase n=1 Tax=Pluteus cervinus TaxID=181527 RepID=A0ACD3BD18_9AGAR|nr:S-adenosyl-L-methionine-dependent methyltransferase [Pluteus cervinus]
MVTRQSSKDPYGLFHLTLNRLPGESDAEPRTEWMNMGYWEKTDMFPEACEALAMKLVQAARFKAGGKILDVGHGTGESLVFLTSNPGVPRPSYLAGITSIPSHHKRSETRLAKCIQSLRVGERPETTLYAGDAIYRADAPAHPFHPESTVSFDAILALDCAYHFNTRNLFLKQSFTHLAPGGRIALADICFAPDAFQSFSNVIFTTLFKLMPKSNQITTDGYIQQLEDLGYSEAELEDITRHVFPSFIRFLKSRGIGWWVFATILERYVNCGVRFVVVSACKK